MDFPSMSPCTNFRRLGENLSAMKKLERLRAFFRFCHHSDWIPDNPARKVKNSLAGGQDSSYLGLSRMEGWDWR